MAEHVAGQPEDLRRRIRGWRTAERREQAVRAEDGPMDPSAALVAADEIYAFCHHMLLDADVVRSQELAHARAAWRTLRSRLRSRSSRAEHP